jgi:3-deoxy-7-phosphoheptulonate synthase
MIDKRIENLNVYSEDTIITPDRLKAMYPRTENIVQTVMKGQQIIKNILDRTDHRLFLVVGPCSIHDVEAAQDYATRLKQLAQEVEDTFLLVMRIYFEKPRTRIGWQGLINDPYMDESCDIEEGLKRARKLLVTVVEMGLPAAGEALDLISPQYVQDLFSWTAIGARTTESQTHRKMASGFSCPVGFKNGTDGNMSVAINAMQPAAHRNNFVSVDPFGRVAIIRTKGNPYTHIVLRGGRARPNYDSVSVSMCEKLLEEASLFPNIMVDCSHDNAQKDPARQPFVMRDIAHQLLEGNESIIGLMIESNLEWGKQTIGHDPKKLKYGVSVTDACIDWQTTEASIRDMYDRLKNVLPTRKRLKT